MYKPPGYSLSSIVGILRQKMVQDLNCMERFSEQSVDESHLLSDSDSTVLLENNSSELINLEPSSSAVVSSSGEIRDYSSHPSVLGPGYSFSDMSHKKVNQLGFKVSGLSLVGLNDVGVARARTLVKSRLISTFQVRGEFGRATRTGWSDGKTAKCSGYKHLAAKTHSLEQLLVNISSAHQARSWSVAQVGLDTQEAYHMACEGPPRPKLLSETLIYNMKLRELELPHFMLEVQCVVGDNDQEQTQLVRLIEELGIKCRTVACVHSIRCAALGPWTTDHSLLVKQINLQTVLNNMSVNRKLYKEFIARRQPHRPNIVKKKSKNKVESNL